MYIKLYSFRYLRCLVKVKMFCLREFLGVLIKSKTNLQMRVIILHNFCSPCHSKYGLDFHKLNHLKRLFRTLCEQGPKKRYMSTDFYISDCFADR